MKLLTSLLLAASASAVAITSRQQGNSALQKGEQTLVLKEVGGIPGNECLTFRNNGAHILSTTPPVAPTDPQPQARL